MEIAPQSIKTIKETSHLILKDAEAIILEMYKNLFNEFPFMIPIFAHAKADHHKRMTQMLVKFIDNIDNLDDLNDDLTKVAFIHFKHRVQRDFYPLLGTCFIKAIHTILKEEATHAVEQAWTDAYIYMSESIMLKEKSIHKSA